MKALRGSEDAAAAASPRLTDDLDFHLVDRAAKAYFGAGNMHELASRKSSTLREQVE